MVDMSQQACITHAFSTCNCPVLNFQCELQAATFELSGTDPLKAHVLAAHFDPPRKNAQILLVQER